MPQQKPKQMSANKALAFSTFIVVLLFTGFLYTAISQRSIVAFMAAGFLALILVSIIIRIILKRKSHQARAIKITVKNPVQHIALVDAPDIVIGNSNRKPPPFKSVIYDKNNLPNLSRAAELLWQNIQTRIKRIKLIITSGLFIVVLMNWVLMKVFSSLFTDINFSTFDHIKFTLFTVIISIILLSVNIPSRIAMGIPLLLAIIWMSHPIIKALKLLLANDTSDSSSEIISLLAGGVIIIVIWFVYSAARIKKFRATAQAGLSAKLLFLWVFRTEAAYEMIVNFGYKWRMLGPTFFLNGTGLMSTDDLKTAINFFKKRKLIIRTEDDLKDFNLRKKNLPSAYGLYEIQSMLCGNGIWKQAIENFMQEKDVVLMSLCGYREENRGCEYEIKKLVNQVPSEKIVLMVNEATDMNALNNDLKVFWDNMSPSSPNLRDEPPPITIYKLTTAFTSELDKGLKSGESADTLKTFKRLKDLAQEGDNIVRLLCQCLTKEVSLKVNSRPLGADA